jgi:type I restriction-modification system DNA methylase subunit
MNTASHNKIVSFIWSIADDCLRDVYVLGKYRDVILPMVVLRRLDALLEISKDVVMEELRFQTEDAGFTELDDNGLQEASGYVFYNTSKWTLQLLHDTATNSQQLLESNFKEYIDIIENDFLEAIIQLPNNLFYNTGIITYIWILGNNKKANRKGKVKLIDAGQLYRKLRKNLGNKNCEFAPEHIEQIIDVYQNLTAVERLGDEGIASKVFDNQDFGYYKVTIERPKRLKAQFLAERIADLRFANNLREPMT